MAKNKQARVSKKKEADKSKCPCCDKPLHENQKDPDTGEKYTPIPEMKWYENIVDYYTERKSQIPKFPNLSNGVKEEITKKADEVEKAINTIKQAKNKSPPCPNFHNPPDTNCGTHFNKTNPEPTSKEVKKKNNWESTRRQYIRDCKNRGIEIKNNSQINHKTAVDAGGCPNNFKNLIADEEITDPICKEAEKAQTLIQNRKPNIK